MLRRRLKHRALLAALLFASLALSRPTQAQTDCPNGDVLPPYEQLAPLAEALAREAERCQRDAAYLAWRGAVLGALGRAAEAAVLLERSLLLNPEHAGARMDYAFALAALGDTQAAAALLRELASSDDLPEHLRAPLVQRVEQLDAVLWRRRGQLTVRLGRESNLTSAPVRESIDLSFPGGEVSMMLSERYRARAGRALALDAALHAQRPLETGGHWALVGDLRWRQAPGLSAADYAQLDATTQWVQPVFAEGDLLAALGISALRFGGQDIYRAGRLSLARGWRLDRCRPRLGLEGEWRVYPETRSLDGVFTSLSASTLCFSGTYRQLLALRLGKDYARQDRPGGDQWRLDLRHAYSRPWLAGRLDADLALSMQTDATGYSPLLAQNAARRLYRFALRLEYSQPIGGGWEALLSGELSQQRSNLPLFDVDGRALWIGLRHRWP